MARLSSRLGTLAFGATLLLTVGCSHNPGSLEVGDAMPALGWEGYVNEEGTQLSSDLPYGDYGTEQLRASGKRFAFIHLSESF